jgi:hypothetical protein
MAMPSFGTLARVALSVAVIAFASPVSAQDIGGVIALPDAPFVLPYYSDQRFPADPRSGDVLTQRANNNRDGPTYVPGLNSDTVRGFRPLGFMPANGDGDCHPDAPEDPHCDGGDIWTQPLYASAAKVHDLRQPVVLFATSNNFVYAYSAAGPPFNKLWSRQLGPPYAGTADPAGKRCSGQIGIEATPVVDLPRNRIIVSFMSDDAIHHVWALDLNDGHVISRGDIHVQIANWDRMHRNRASLLLADDVIYVAMAGICFGLEYHGSIVAFRATDLQQAGFFAVTTAPVSGGAIWQASSGLAADSSGNLYVATGDKILVNLTNPHTDDFNFTDSVLRLKIDKKELFDRGAPSLTFHVADYFTPYRKVWLDWNDMDVSSGGVAPIPGSRYLVAGGKEGVLYVLDRADLGHFDQRPADFGWRSAEVNHYVNDPAFVSRTQLLHDDPGRDLVHQKFPAGLNRYDVPGCSGADASRRCFFAGFNRVSLQTWREWPHIHGTPVFARFRDDAQFLFVWPEKDHLKRFTWNGARFDPTPLEPTPLDPTELAPPIALLNTQYFQKPSCPIEGSPPEQNCHLTEKANGMPGGMLAVNLDGDSGRGVVFASLPRCARDLQPPDPIRPPKSAPLHRPDPWAAAGLRSVHPNGGLERLWPGALARRLQSRPYWDARSLGRLPCLQVRTPDGRQRPRLSRHGRPREGDRLRQLSDGRGGLGKRVSRGSLPPRALLSRAS